MTYNPHSPVKMMLDAAFGRQQPRMKVGSTDSAALNAVAEAAVAWWEARRPAGWSMEQYLVDPAANCENDYERELAEAAAKWVAHKK
jgi:hypothetical protein